MRVLVAGDWHSEIHEEVAAQALRDLGHEVREFRWSPYFSLTKGIFREVRSLIRKFQNKYIVGPLIVKINSLFIKSAVDFKPDIIFIYRGTHISRKSLERIKKNLPGCVLIGYNNDDPFSPKGAPYLWSIFLKAIPMYDLILAYRHANINEYELHGAQRVELLRSWFVPKINHPVQLGKDDERKYLTDVVFVGHYENDQRLEYLEEIVKQGIQLRIFGPGWDPILKQSTILKSLSPIELVWGQDYNKALCGSKIALCFFSKINRDTYTRRCFEIPATGTLMLSEFSDDLASLYEEGKEVDYFRSKIEMIEKIKKYLNDSSVRKTVAEAGLKRVNYDGHDILSRMRQVVKWAESIQSCRELNYCEDN
jgi:spore maturation protein CgeB